MMAEVYGSSALSRGTEGNVPCTAGAELLPSHPGQGKEDLQPAGMRHPGTAKPPASSSLRGGKPGAGKVTLAYPMLMRFTVVLTAILASETCIPKGELKAHAGKHLCS